jgi:hypothetical protein
MLEAFSHASARGHGKYMPMVLNPPIQIGEANRKTVCKKIDADFETSNRGAQLISGTRPELLTRGDFMSNEWDIKRLTPQRVVTMKSRSEMADRKTQRDEDGS